MRTAVRSTSRYKGPSYASGQAINLAAIDHLTLVQCFGALLSYVVLRGCLLVPERIRAQDTRSASRKIPGARKIPRDFVSASPKSARSRDFGLRLSGAPMSVSVRDYPGTPGIPSGDKP